MVHIEITEEEFGLLVSQPAPRRPAIRSTG